MADKTLDRVRAALLARAEELEGIQPTLSSVWARPIPFQFALAAEFRALAEQLGPGTEPRVVDPAAALKRGAA